MKKLVAVFFAALVGFQSQAYAHSVKNDVVVAFASGKNVLAPPARYKRKAFKVKPTYFHVRPEKVRAKCRQVSRQYGGSWNPPARIGGCAIYATDWSYCAIVLPNEDTQWYTVDELKAHEDAHCKDWKHR